MHGSSRCATTRWSKRLRFSTPSSSTSSGRVSSKAHIGNRRSGRTNGPVRRGVGLYVDYFLPSHCVGGLTPLALLLHRNPGKHPPHLRDLRLLSVSIRHLHASTTLQ